MAKRRAKMLYFLYAAPFRRLLTFAQTRSAADRAATSTTGWIENE
jgi:hypothetical protein